MNYLLGAFPPELGPWLKDPPRGWTAQLTGIGGMEAGLTVQALLQHHPGARVLFIGTCGAFDLERYPLGTIVEIREATTRSLGEVSGDSFHPPEETLLWPQSWSLEVFPQVRAVCPPAITHSVSGAKELASFGEIEHLEAAAIFAACHRLSVPVTACLVVANVVGPEGHEQWKTYHQTFMEELRSKLLPRLI